MTRPFPTEEMVRCIASLLWGMHTGTFEILLVSVAAAAIDEAIGNYFLHLLYSIEG
jgi:hypothetical protein